MKQIPGQMAIDGSVSVELTDSEVSLVVTALVCLAAQLADAGIDRATARMPGEATDLANRLARTLA